MRRLPRALLITPAAVTLCAITLLLLVGSGLDFQIPLTRDGRWAITSLNGRLRLDNEPERRRWEAQWEAYRAARDLAYRDYVSRRELDPSVTPPAQSEPPPPPELKEYASLQYLSAAGMSGALALALYLWRCAGQKLRRDRRANCLCAHCGYDLRATPDRCPECGTVARAST